jgi:2',3'-cyclic-nucleotide 2'-phosphodiesterase / 3'-nucleotidase
MMTRTSRLLPTALIALTIASALACSLALIAAPERHISTTSTEAPNSGAPWVLARQAASEQRQPGAPGARVHLVLLATTDLHGRIEPLDYWTNKPANLGLAKIATLIRRVRAEQPNVLLFDSGDAIQGTPFAYYFARKDTARPNPMMLAMNAVGYDAMAVGNHEFNFGLRVLLKVRKEAHFTILGANVLEANGSPGCANCPTHFQPYVLKDVAGVRVGIAGFVTPSIPSFELPQNYKGYRFAPIVETAQRVIPELRRQADLVVVLSHSGLGPDPIAGTGGDPRYLDLPGEQTTIALAEQVPGIDVILFGHTHQELAGRTINGALLVQPKNWGGSLARVDIDIERDPQGRWQVEQKRSTLLPVTAETVPDPEIMRLAEPYERTTQAYLDAPIATSAKTLTGEKERYEDGPLVDLIQNVQLSYGHADVSLATMFVPTMRIDAGRVTVRQASALYPYDNTLYVVEMTGAQLHQALEHAASFYSRWPLAPGQLPHLPSYYADSAEGAGLSYTIDLTRPLGERIVDLRYHNAPLDPAKKLRVAINNYRYTGGGGYEFKNLPVLYRSPQEMRDLLIEYLSRTGTIPTAADHHWRIVPQTAVTEMLRVARAEDPASYAPKWVPESFAMLWAMHLSSGDLPSGTRENSRLLPPVR